MERHQLSAAFPDMPDEDFQDLLESIKTHGQREPITTYENKILDGWHRFRACLQLDINPSFHEYDGKDPVAYVIDLNLHRRHLSPAQKAMAVVTCSTWAGVGTPLRKYQIPPAGGITSDEMAKRAGVGKRSVERAKKVAQSGDQEVIEAVKKGAMSLSEAIRVVDRDDPENAPPAPVKPVLKSAVAQDKYDALKVAYDELNEQYQEILDNYQELAKEVTILTALRDTEHYQTMKQMQSTIDNLTEARDKWQRECAELKKQVLYWKKHADRKSA
jgi:ParB-like chromosome segregation protein Spo0J